jgi:hypothetical protein
MSITDQEQIFLDKIDCNFPHQNALQAAALITEAWSLSSNAAFCVLYEIVCPPASEEVHKQTQRELLAAWLENSALSLAAAVAEFAKQVLEGEVVSTAQTLQLMGKVASIRGQYAALAVVSHLAYQTAENADYVLIDALEQEIRDRWDIGLTAA